MQPTVQQPSGYMASLLARSEGIDRRLLQVVEVFVAAHQLSRSKGFVSTRPAWMSSTCLLIFVIVSVTAYV